MRVGLDEALWALQGWAGRAVARVVLVVAGMAGLSLVAGGVWWVATAVAAHRQEAALERRWADMGRPLGSVLGRFPARSTSASAHRLEQLAASLGLDLVPRDEEDRVTPDPAAAAAFTAVKGALDEYVDEVARSERRQLPQLPHEVRTFLLEHDAEMQAVVDHLTTAAPVRWLQEPERAFQGPLPNLLGQMHLSRLLTASAVLQLQSDRPLPAARAADAAWRLQRAAVGRPELISQLVGMVQAQRVAAVARSHPDPPAHWPAMLLEHDYRRSTLDAIHWEAWAVWQASRRGQVLDEGREAGLFMHLILDRYIGLQMTYVAEAARTAVERLPQVPFPAFDPGEGFVVALESVVGDRKVARLGLVDYWSSWSRAGHCMLALELSAMVAELQHGGSPTSPPPVGLRCSRLMPEVAWRFTSEEGGIRIAAAQELPPVPVSAAQGLCRSFVLEGPW